MWSPFYINLREVYSKPTCIVMMRKICAGMSGILERDLADTTKLVGVATAGIPIASILTFSTGIPSCYTAKFCDERELDDPKDEEESPSPFAAHGERALVHGDLDDGDRLVLIDDIVTDGNSKLLARNLVDKEAKRRGVDVTCKDAIVVIDREQGGGRVLNDNGMQLYSLIQLRTRGVRLLEGIMEPPYVALIEDYLEDPRKYQDEDFRTKASARITDL